MTMYINDLAPPYQKQRDDIRLPRTLMGGTSAMREAKSLYLPQKDAEEDKEYQKRLQGAVLKNYMAKTVDYLAGQVFQKPVDYQPLQEGRKPEYNEAFFQNFKENVDLSNNNLSAFSLDVFKDGLIDGLSFIVVDYSRVNLQENDEGVLLYETAEGTFEPKTQEADSRNGWRPYFVKVKAEQVLDAWVIIQDGQEVLRHFRYEEVFERAKDEQVFDRELVTRIRAFWPGRWEVWENSQNSSQPILIDQGRTNLDYVPVFWFMPGKRGENAVTATPPLADLAEMNRAHWNSYSHHLELMKWVRSPVWLGINLFNKKDDPIAFGPSRYICVSNNGISGVSADLKSVGVDTNSITKSQDDLKEMESAMEAYGLQVALNPAGYSTATQIATVANASDSQLKGWCVGFQDCLENALKAVANYNNEMDGPAVYVNSSFRQSFETAKATFLKSMYDSQSLSLPTFLSEIKQMGGINDEIVISEEIERIEQEAAGLLPTLSGAVAPQE